ncbi:Protein of unknown function [Cotesia congregata]|uniref:Reverse transcriptase domain-containing protein n=1 Tax=Cotesia congregata TaxID=51543 RepID=A0A8J2HLP8_COTCN|nr:Protein of unknown function [Cotesia congregata]
MQLTTGQITIWTQYIRPSAEFLPNIPVTTFQSSSDHYWKPSIDFENACTSLQDTLNDILNPLCFDVFIIGGDFNARVGQIQRSVPLILEDTPLEFTRTTQDHTTNEKGYLLNNLRDENGFVLLNGRTPGDIPGKFTFGNALGKSTIDLVWVHYSSLAFVKDLSVRHIISQSAHFPVAITLALPLPESALATNAPPQPSLRWNSKYAARFKTNLQRSPLVSQNFLSSSCSNLYQTLTEAITQAADGSNMYCLLSLTYKPISARWFDDKCRSRKRLVSNYLHICKGEGSTSLLWNYFYAATKHYYALIRRKISEHQTKISNLFANTNNSTDFWRTVNGEVPQEWYKVCMFMLHKKGDTSNPHNYQGIALVNCVTKIFTSIINERLRFWAETNGLLPEEQAGFRKGKSCGDNVFTLQSILQLFIRHKRASALVLLIDYVQNSSTS